MAKASTGHKAPAKVKPASMAAPASKKAKSAATPVKAKADKAVKPPVAKPASKTAKAKTVAPRPAPGGRKVAAAAKTAVAAIGQAKATDAKVQSKPAAAKEAARGVRTTVAMKQAARRRPATRTAVPVPVARRRHPVNPGAQPSAAKPPAAGMPQVFTVSHLNQADFKADGLRPYAQYRDLGIAAATAGLCQAHVIRMIPPCTDIVRKRHVHQAELQLVYVLKGWMKNEFEGHGEQMMSTGSCWLQPTGIRHTVLDYSPDCEVLEIIVPANFTTEEVA